VVGGELGGQEKTERKKKNSGGVGLENPPQRGGGEKKKHKRLKPTGISRFGEKKKKNVWKSNLNAYWGGGGMYRGIKGGGQNPQLEKQNETPIKLVHTHHSKRGEKRGGGKCKKPGTGRVGGVVGGDWFSTVQHRTKGRRKGRENQTLRKFLGECVPHGGDKPGGGGGGRGNKRIGTVRGRGQTRERRGLKC